MYDDADYSYYHLKMLLKTCCSVVLVCWTGLNPASKYDVTDMGLFVFEILEAGDPKATEKEFGNPARDDHLEVDVKPLKGSQGTETSNDFKLSSEVSPLSVSDRFSLVSEMSEIIYFTGPSLPLAGWRYIG